MEAMTSRQRVMHALNFQPVDRVPRDLGGMLSTGISCFAYPKLVRALNLPQRLPMVHDDWQMLALPELDVLDALGCDVVSVYAYPMVTNAFEAPGRWHAYDFNGRLPARVLDPSRFRALPNGAIEKDGGRMTMLPGAHVFDEAHGGQAFSLIDDLPKPDPIAFRDILKAERMSDQRIDEIARLCQRTLEVTDRAVMFNGLTAGIAIGGHGGIAIFPMLCLREPKLIEELHEVAIEHTTRELERLLNAIHPYIDVYMINSDDWGLQQHLAAPPSVFEELFLPFYRQINAVLHTHAPGVKSFLHSCGAIYEIIPMLIESGFDVLNPVQWSAGGHSFREWKSRCEGRLAIWGGGVNTQKTLPFGTVEDVEAEVREVVTCLSAGSGYVFNSIHNILAEVEPEKIIAMYRVAGEVRPQPAGQ